MDCEPTVAEAVEALLVATDTMYETLLRGEIDAARIRGLHRLIWLQQRLLVP